MSEYQMGDVVIYNVHYRDQTGKLRGKPRPLIRVFDETEMCNLVDSSLEFWLTYGRYSKEFEKRLAEFLGIKYAFLVNSGSSANLLAFMALTSPLLKDRAVGFLQGLTPATDCFSYIHPQNYNQK